MLRILALLLIALVGGCRQDRPLANAIELERFEIRADGIEPTWTLSLSDQLLAAVESGVEVTLLENWQWRDGQQAWRDGAQRRLQLSHDVLTGNYLIRHLERDELRVFPGRSALLRGIRRTGLWPERPPSEAQALRFRLTLQRTSLPGSLRLQAVWNDHWHADSGWQQRSLQPEAQP